MSRHARFQQWVSRSLDRELGEVERRELRAHLADCADCRLVADQLDGLQRLLREDAGTTGSVGLGARIWARVEAERRPAPTHGLRPAVRRSRVPALRRSAALAAGLLLCLGVFHVSRLPGEALAEDPAPVLAPPLVDQRVQEILKQRPQRAADEQPSLLDLFLLGERR